jgi:hypothetical protein
MIYQRSGENDENGVRYRLAACRKRLRLIRANHRAKPLQLDETLREIAISPFGSIVRYPAATGGSAANRRQQKPGDCERLLQAISEDQEGGKT